MRKSILILALLLANPFYVICLAEQNRRHTPAAKSNVPRRTIHTCIRPWLSTLRPPHPRRHFLDWRRQAMGVAYSKSGRLEGPWIQEKEPLTPPNHGHGMIFKDLEGRNILSAHSHSEINGRYVRRPVFWEIDLTGDKLRIIRKIDWTRHTNLHKFPQFRIITSQKFIFL